MFCLVGEPGSGKTSAAIWLEEQYPDKIAFVRPIVARSTRANEASNEVYGLGYLRFRTLLERSFEDKHFQDPELGRPILIHHSLEAGFFTVERALKYFRSSALTPLGFRAVSSRGLNRAFEQGKIPIIVGPPWLVRLSLQFPNVATFYFLGLSREDAEARLRNRDGRLSNHAKNRLDAQYIPDSSEGSSQKRLKLDDSGRLMEQIYAGLLTERLEFITNMPNPAGTLHPTTKEHLQRVLLGKFDIT